MSRFESVADTVADKEEQTANEGFEKEILFTKYHRKRRVVLTSFDIVTS